MKSLVLTDSWGNPLLVDSSSILKAYWVDTYGPTVQTRVILAGGYDALVQESVEKIAEEIKK